MRGLTLAGLLCVLASFAEASAKHQLPNDASKVMIGVDCGSSGSRVCVYYYDKVGNPPPNSRARGEGSDWLKFVFLITWGGGFASYLPRSMLAGVRSGGSLLAIMQHSFLRYPQGTAKHDFFAYPPFFKPSMGLG